MKKYNSTPALVLDNLFSTHCIGMMTPIRLCMRMRQMQSLRILLKLLLILDFTLSTLPPSICTPSRYSAMSGTLTILQGKFYLTGLGNKKLLLCRMIEVQIPVENWFIFVIDEWLDTAGGGIYYLIDYTPMTISCLIEYRMSLKLPKSSPLPTNASLDCNWGDNTSYFSLV